MKKIILLVIIFLILLIGSTIILKPALVDFAKKKIEHAIPNSTIVVEQLHFYYTPWSLIQQKATGNIIIKSFKHGKLKAENIKATLRWEGRYVFMDTLSGHFLNGTVDGKGNVIIGKIPKYLVQLNFNNLDLARFVHDFELRDKVEMTGMLSGNVTLNGIGNNMNILNGNFSTSASGGNITIKDTKFLENMAHNAKLPANIVVDSFKDYHYNIGLVHMFLDKGDLVLDVGLGGATGKRNLKVDLHEFSLK